MTYDEINTFCRNKVIPVLYDNIFMSNVIHNRFFKKPKKWDGGEFIEAPIEYAKNTNAESYAGATALTIANVEIATKARLPVRQYNSAITITGVDEAMNKGAGKIIDLVTARTKNSYKSLADLIVTGFFAAQANTKIDGVGGVFAASGATTYAGLCPNDFAEWKSNGGAGPTAVNGDLTLAKLQTDWSACSIDQDTPTLIVTTSDIWDGIEATLIEKNKRYEDKKMANLGFENITLHGKPIVHDSHCTAEALYLFNERYLKVWILGGMNFKFIPFSSPVNSDTKTAHTRWYGNLLCTNVYKQGQMTGITGVA